MLLYDIDLMQPLRVTLLRLKNNIQYKDRHFKDEIFNTGYKNIYFPDVDIQSMYKINLTINNKQIIIQSFPGIPQNKYLYYYSTLYTYTKDKQIKDITLLDSIRSYIFFINTKQQFNISKHKNIYKNTLLEIDHLSHKETRDFIYYRIAEILHHLNEGTLTECSDTERERPAPEYGLFKNKFCIKKSNSLAEIQKKWVEGNDIVLLQKKGKKCKHCLVNKYCKIKNK